MQSIRYALINDYQLVTGVKAKDIQSYATFQLTFFIVIYKLSFHRI